MLHGTSPEPKRYVTMTVTWTIILAWLALQLPLAVLIGKSIKFGTIGYKKRRAPARDPRFYPGMVWCLQAASSPRPDMSQ